MFHKTGLCGTSLIPPFGGFKDIFLNAAENRKENTPWETYSFPT